MTKWLKSFFRFLFRVSETWVVKISDFGMARVLYNKVYYKIKQGVNPALPTHWMAIESLKERLFNSKTDVVRSNLQIVNSPWLGVVCLYVKYSSCVQWSFGVLLWELCTRGSMPYADVAHFDILSYLESGHRLPTPRCASRIMWDPRLSCRWLLHYDEEPYLPLLCCLQLW